MGYSVTTGARTTHPERPDGCVFVCCASPCSDSVACKTVVNTPAGCLFQTFLSIFPKTPSRTGRSRADPADPAYPFPAFTQHIVPIMFTRAAAGEASRFDLPYYQVNLARRSEDPRSAIIP